MPLNFFMDWNSQPIKDLIRRALEEDVGSGDVTVQATIPRNTTAKAHILARQELVCVGLPIAKQVFRMLDPDIPIEFCTADGDSITANSDLLRLEGNARAILTGERTALNFLAHLSGIATMTAKFVKQLAGTKAKIRDTRKTTPGLRLLEKYAVKMGGGTNPRLGLYDAILLKENHIAVAGGVKAAMDKAHTYASSQRNPQEMTAYEAAASPQTDRNSTSLPIQIEVRNERELREALGAGAEAILLDNMTPEMATQCVVIARNLRHDCVIEISGGITLENARAYAETGADYLSSGALTHSAPAANLSLLVDSIQ